MEVQPPRSSPGLSRYRSLKGLAHNLAFQFALSCEHIAYLALQAGLPKLQVDLMLRRIDPGWLEIPRNLNLVGICYARLEAYMESVSPGMIVNATLCAYFEPYDHVEDPETCWKGRARSWIWAKILDDKGRTWTSCLHHPDQLIQP
jgi:hypothetical protein